MSWVVSTIGDVCVPTPQRNPATGSGEFRYIDIAGIDRDMKVIAAANSIPCNDAPSRARKEVKAGDVLVSTVRPNLNAVAQVPPDLDGEIASTGFAVLRAKQKVVDARYLFYRVQHQEFVDSLVANATGASYPAVSDAIVRRASLPLPPPSEQRRIVEILDQADALRKMRRDADTKTARILPALFLKMFGDPQRNPFGLEKKSLGELVRVKSGNFLAGKDMTDAGPFPVYGGNGVNGHHGEYMFEERKIVLGRVGAYCGAVHYTEPRSWITDNALYISEKLQPLADYYLVAALRQANLNQYAGRAGQPLISGSRIYPVEILRPSEDAQLDFAKIAEKTIGLCVRLSSASVRLGGLWDRLLQRAFSGQLTAKWRQVHMQELLIEMQEQARLLNLLAPN